MPLNRGGCQLYSNLWIDDSIVLKQGSAHEKGRLGEEPDEVKVSSPVLKTSRPYKGKPEIGLLSLT